MCRKNLQSILPSLSKFVLGVARVNLSEVLFYLPKRPQPAVLILQRLQSGTFERFAQQLPRGNKGALRIPSLSL